MLPPSTIFGKLPSTNFKKLLTQADEPCLLRIQYDMILRVFELEKILHPKTSEQERETQQLIEKTKAYAKRAEPDQHVLNYYSDTFWALDLPSSHYAVGYMMRWWVNKDEPKIDIARHSLNENSLELRHLLKNRKFLYSYIIEESFDIQDRWVYRRLEHLLTLDEEALWTIEENELPKHMQVSYFQPMVIDAFIKTQRTFPPSQREKLLAKIIHESDSTWGWFCHIPKLDLYWVEVLGPNHKKHTHYKSRYEWVDKLSWKKAWIRVSEPEDKASFLMLKEAGEQADQ